MMSFFAEGFSELKRRFLTLKTLRKRMIDVKTLVNHKMQLAASKKVEKNVSVMDHYRMAIAIELERRSSLGLFDKRVMGISRYDISEMLMFPQAYETAQTRVMQRVLEHTMKKQHMPARLFYASLLELFCLLSIDKACYGNPMVAIAHRGGMIHIAHVARVCLSRTTSVEEAEEMLLAFDQESEDITKKHL